MDKQLAIEKWRTKKFKGDNFHTWIYDQTFPLTDLKRLGKPFSMVALEINAREFIVMGVDNEAQTPHEFLINNKLAYFTLDTEMKSSKIKSQIGYVVVHYAKRMSNSEFDLPEISIDRQNPMISLDFIFNSEDHIRYEHGKRVSGPHGGAPRAIKVVTHSDETNCYTVSIFNTEGGVEELQMAPKQMKIFKKTDKIIELLGYGYDLLGEPFDNYGLTIYHDQGIIEKCTLHLLDRNVDIEYLLHTPKLKNGFKLKNWIQKYLKFS